MRASWLRVAIVAVTLLLASAVSAQADLFTFTVSGPNVSGSGTITATPNGALYDATMSSGSLTVFGQRIDLLRASGTFNRTTFALQLYNDNLESTFFTGSNTGGTFSSSVAMRGGNYTVFDVQDAPSGSGGAPLPEAGSLLSALMACGVVGLVALRRTRPG